MPCRQYVSSHKIITDKQMKIGNIQFGDNPIMLAPMEDVTDIGFRHLCKRFGAAMV